MLLLGTQPALADEGDPAGTTQAIAPNDTSSTDDTPGVWVCDNASGTADDPATCTPETGPGPDPLGQITPAKTGPYRACDYDERYSFTNRRGSKISYYHATSLNDDVTIQVGISKGSTVTGTLTGSGTFSIGAIVAEAQAQVSSSIAWAKTTTYTASLAWHIPKGHKLPARLDVGAQSRWMKWQHNVTRANCSVVRVGSGTTNLPTDVPVFWHN
jgi:hypothetical protein